MGSAASAWRGITSPRWRIGSGRASIRRATGHHGCLTGLAAGSSLVSASFGGATASTTVTVPSDVTLSSIAITPANADVLVGAQQQFVATATYSDSSSAVISATWGSSATANATVDRDGLATGALSNGATAAEVNWVPTGTSTLGANSTFKGNILSQSAIGVGDNTTLVNGRGLSATSATLSNNLISNQWSAAATCAVAQQAAAPAQAMSRVSSRAAMAASRVPSRQ